ncbi:putative ribonuclease H-like domain-containing protein [Tanacetum coccineum]
MCDKKNSVLFTDTGCFVLSPDFKLADESQVLLKVPRKNNMYSVDMKNIVPKESLTCLVAKATLDESMLWHRRLGHVNFKTINKLVKDNLVKGLPIKRFENDQTCVACLKGKQHKASCKSKIQNSITQPLFMLHMDLFGPTFVSSLMNKKYCLVVTDDYSRFTWVFFLASKDETSGILKSFITQIENLVDKKVKIIRCDNGTEFKNRVMSEFCEKKGIKREFSVARTPQQNGVAERRNRTLIEAARTMLADSKLPTTFWAEAVNTACYVQNRVLVVKPHNKTPYELFRGRTPSLSFMKPFGCHVTILNSLDHLGKFDGKSDDGFFVGYSLNSKAFRVYNIRTRKVEENLHVRFLEDKPIIAGDRLKWLFDIDVLTKSINYVPVVAGTNSNDFVDGSLFDSSSKDASNDEPQPSNDVEKKDDEGGIDDQERTENSAQDVNTAGPSINTASTNFNTGSLNINIVSPTVPTTPLESTYVDFFGDESQLDLSNIATTYLVPSTPNIRIHKDHSLDHEEPKKTLVDLPYGKRAIGTKWLYRNKKDERGIVIRNKARLVTQGYTQEEVIDYDKVFAHVARIEAIRLFLAYASFKDFVVYQMDVKSAFLYGKIKEEVYVCQSSGFEDPDFLDRVYKVEKALYGLHQAPRACQDKYVDDILKKFGFSTVKTASTLMETSKTLLKDAEAEDVDVHLYRSMIGSLMYLTTSRPDIMFVVCSCVRFQVTPKVSHLHAMKRIFRYLKGQPKLGLWYPKESPFDLEAYTDSDYAGASLDRKSTTGGCQFLGSRLISWKCKKQSIVANSTTKAEYAAAASCCGQGEGSTVPVESHHTPTNAPSTSQPPSSLPFKRTTRQEFVVPQPRSLTQTNLVDNAASTDVDVIRGGDVTTVTSLNVGHDSGNIDKTPLMPHDSPLPRVHTLGSDEGRMQHNELMDLVTKLSNRVVALETDLKQTKQIYGITFTKLIQKVKKLEKIVKSSQARRKARIVGRHEHDMESDFKFTVAEEVYTAEKGVSTTELVSTAGVTVTTASASISTACPTRVSTADDITLAETLVYIRRSVAKDKATMRLQAELEEEKRQRIARVHEEASSFNVEEWENIQARVEADEEIATRLQTEEQGELTIEERSRLFVELMDKRKKYFATKRAEERRNKLLTQDQQRTYMLNYIKHMGSHTLQHSKRQKTGESLELAKEPRDKDDELSQEELQQMMIIVPEEGINIEALQTKYPIIDWKVYTEYSKNLVQERFNSIEPTKDKEREIWVELKRLFKPDADDELWKSQKYIHDITWRLYDTCGVHHVSTKDGVDIYMLVEREYPLSRGVLTQMLIAKILVEQDNEMYRELLRNIFMQVERPRR